MINPNLLDLDLEDTDIVSNAPVVSILSDNLSFPNEQSYEICSQLNEGQYNLLNLIMQYTLHCKLTEKIVATQTISNIFKCRCWCWKKLCNQGNN